MHFEILVEGQSDNVMLSGLMHKIIGDYRSPHTWMIHKHRDGLGVLPLDLSAKPNIRDQSLLHNLPAKLKAYGKENNPELVVVVLVDLDEREDCVVFKNQLIDVLNYCHIKPRILIRIAIDELEAWYLGDQPAIKLAYPEAKLEFLKNYIPDSKIGSWEKLAEIIYPGGLDSLLVNGKRSKYVLEEKKKWAKNIARCMNVEQNLSPSFCCFRDGLRRIVNSEI